MSWPVIYHTHCTWTGQTCIVHIVDWLAGLIITLLYMDWPDLYCIHCRLTGWSDNNSIVNGLARPVLYPFLTGWPAVVCNPTLGLHGNPFSQISHSDHASHIVHRMCQQISAGHTSAKYYPI